MRRLIVTGLALLLCGCASVFAPPFDDTVNTQALAAYGIAAKISAEIQLGQFSAPASYAGAADQYVSLMSDIAIARERALTLPATTAISQDARTRLGQILQACSDNAKTLAGLHQKVGLQPATGADTELMNACDQAAKAAAALKP